MKYFWFDHKRTSSELPENETFRRLVTLFDAQYVSAAALLDDQPFICFVHAGGAIVDWEGRAKPSSKQFVALLSFGSDPTSDKTEADGVVLLQKVRLGRGLSVLERDPKGLEEFRASAIEGRPHWNLLVVELETDKLVAFYLVQRAMDRGVAVTLDDGLRNQAYFEYKALAKHWKYPTVPSGPTDLPDMMTNIAELLHRRASE